MIKLHIPQWILIFIIVPTSERAKKNDRDIFLTTTRATSTHSPCDCSCQDFKSLEGDNPDDVTFLQEKNNAEKYEDENNIIYYDNSNIEPSPRNNFDFNTITTENFNNNADINDIYVLNSCNSYANTTTIYLAGYDDEIFKIKHDIQQHNGGRDIEIYFYLYKDFKYHNLGHVFTDLQFLKENLFKYTHFFCFDYKSLQSNWCLNNLGRSSSLENSTESAQIIPEIGKNDEHFIDRDLNTNLETSILHPQKILDTYEFILPKEYDIKSNNIIVDLYKMKQQKHNDQSDIDRKEAAAINSMPKSESIYSANTNNELFNDTIIFSDQISQSHDLSQKQHQHFENKNVKGEIHPKEPEIESENNTNSVLSQNLLPASTTYSDNIQDLKINAYDENKPLVCTSDTLKICPKYENLDTKLQNSYKYKEGINIVKAEHLISTKGQEIEKTNTKSPFDIKDASSYLICPSQLLQPCAKYDNLDNIKQNINYNLKESNKQKPFIESGIQTFLNVPNMSETLNTNFSITENVIPTSYNISENTNIKNVQYSSTLNKPQYICHTDRNNINIEPLNIDTKSDKEKNNVKMNISPYDSQKKQMTFNINKPFATDHEHQTIYNIPVLKNQPNKYILKTNNDENNNPNSQKQKYFKPGLIKDVDHPEQECENQETIKSSGVYDPHMSNNFPKNNKSWNPNKRIVKYRQDMNKYFPNYKINRLFQDIPQPLEKEKQYKENPNANVPQSNQFDYNRPEKIKYTYIDTISTNQGIQEYVPVNTFNQQKDYSKPEPDAHRIFQGVYPPYKIAQTIQGKKSSFPLSFSSLKNLICTKTPKITTTSSRNYFPFKLYPKRTFIEDKYNINKNDFIPQIPYKHHMKEIKHPSEIFEPKLKSNKYNLEPLQVQKNPSALIQPGESYQNISPKYNSDITTTTTGHDHIKLNMKNTLMPFYDYDKRNKYFILPSPMNKGSPVVSSSHIHAIPIPSYKYNLYNSERNGIMSNLQNVRYFTQSNVDQKQLLNSKKSLEDVKNNLYDKKKYYIPDVCTYKNLKILDEDYMKPKETKWEEITQPRNDTMLNVGSFNFDNNISDYFLKYPNKNLLLTNEENLIPTKHVKEIETPNIENDTQIINSSIIISESNIPDKETLSLLSPSILKEDKYHTDSTHGHFYPEINETALVLPCKSVPKVELGRDNNTDLSQKQEILENYLPISQSQKLIPQKYLSDNSLPISISLSNYSDQNYKPMSVQQAPIDNKIVSIPSVFPSQKQNKLSNMPENQLSNKYSSFPSLKKLTAHNHGPVLSICDFKPQMIEKYLHKSDLFFNVKSSDKQSTPSFSPFTKVVGKKIPLQTNLDAWPQTTTLKPRVPIESPIHQSIINQFPNISTTQRPIQTPAKLDLGLTSSNYLDKLQYSSINKKIIPISFNYKPNVFRECISTPQSTVFPFSITSPLQHTQSSKQISRPISLTPSLQDFPAEVTSPFLLHTKPKEDFSLYETYKYLPNSATSLPAITPSSTANVYSLTTDFETGKQNFLKPKLTYPSIINSKSSLHPSLSNFKTISTTPSITLPTELLGHTKFSKYLFTQPPYIIDNNKTSVSSLNSVPVLTTPYSLPKLTEVSELVTQPNFPDYLFTQQPDVMKKNYPSYLPSYIHPQNKQQLNTYFKSTPQTVPIRTKSDSISYEPYLKPSQNTESLELTQNLAAYPFSSKANMIAQLSTPSKFVFQLPIPSKYSTQLPTPSKCSTQLPIPTKYSTQLPIPSKYSTQLPTPSFFFKLLIPSKSSFMPFQQNLNNLPSQPQPEKAFLNSISLNSFTKKPNLMDKKNRKDSDYSFYTLPQKESNLVSTNLQKYSSLPLSPIKTNEIFTKSSYNVKFTSGSQDSYNVIQPNAPLPKSIKLCYQKPAIKETDLGPKQKPAVNVSPLKLNVETQLQQTSSEPKLLIQPAVTSPHASYTPFLLSNRMTSFPVQSYKLQLSPNFSKYLNNEPGLTENNLWVSVVSPQLSKKKQEPNLKQNYLTSLKPIYNYPNYISYQEGKPKLMLLNMKYPNEQLSDQNLPQDNKFSTLTRLDKAAKPGKFDSISTPQSLISIPTSSSFKPETEIQTPNSLISGIQFQQIPSSINYNPSPSAGAAPDWTYLPTHITKTLNQNGTSIELLSKFTPLSSTLPSKLALEPNSYFNLQSASTSVSPFLNMQPVANYKISAKFKNKPQMIAKLVPSLLISPAKILNSLTSVQGTYGKVPNVYNFSLKSQPYATSYSPMPYSYQHTGSPMKIHAFYNIPKSTKESTSSNLPYLSIYPKNNLNFKSQTNNDIPITLETGKSTYPIPNNMFPINEEKAKVTKIPYNPFMKQSKHQIPITKANGKSICPISSNSFPTNDENSKGTTSAANPFMEQIKNNIPVTTAAGNNILLDNDQVISRFPNLKEYLANLKTTARDNENIMAQFIENSELRIAKYEPLNINDVYNIKTKNPDIKIQAWASKLTILTPKIVVNTYEVEALNFIPIVKNINKYDYKTIQDIVKDYVVKFYGEPIIMKGVYNYYNPYAFCKIDEGIFKRGIVYLIWPTFCTCGCQKSGCQCKNMTPCQQGC